jgi:alkylated DNA repair dioxygenase AlkB
LTLVTNVRSQLVWQPSLLDAAVAEAGFDPSFAGARHLELDADAWIEHVPGWVTGAGELFDTIVNTAEWSQRRVRMYDRMVDEPRLHAWYELPLDHTFPLPVVPEMARALSERYDRAFDGVGTALYRDGRDSVAWHGDRIPEEIHDPVVALVSLGSPRTLRMRAKFRRRDTRSFPLLPGDLFVMGGASQRTWEHSVPKVARAGPRLSLQFRHSANATVPV